MNSSKYQELQKWIKEDCVVDKTWFFSELFTIFIT